MPRGLRQLRIRTGFSWQPLMKGSTMGAPDPEAMQRVAAECVTLVADQFGRQLDWSLESLAELDSVCAGS